MDGGGGGGGVEGIGKRECIRERIMQVYEPWMYTCTHTCKTTCQSLVLRTRPLPSASLASPAHTFNPAEGSGLVFKTSQ